MSEPVTGVALAVVIAGLASTTLVTRASFLVLNRLRLGHRLEVALRYAPVCTLSAIIVPDVLVHGGTWDLSPLNPRLIGIVAAGIWLCFSRSIVGCLACGMLAFTLVRVYL